MGLSSEKSAYEVLYVMLKQNCVILMHYSKWYKLRISSLFESTFGVIMKVEKRRVQ